MRLATFFHNLAQFEDAPNGILRLRQLIVQLAIEGKLVAQDTRDEPASLLLKKVRNGGNVRRVSRRGLTSSSPVSDAAPFAIPANWEWTSLSQVGHEWGQKKPDVDFTYIDVASIDNKRGVITDELKLLKPNEAPSRARKIVKRGSIIYSTVRPYLLNIAIVDRDYSPEPIASTAFAVIHPFEGISATYLFYYLRSRTFVRFVEEQMQGVAYPAINDEKLFTAAVPLPPSQEQDRIVHRVDELMRLCDDLEAQQQAKRESRVRLNASILAPLNKAASLPLSDFEQAITRLAGNFDSLYDSIDTVHRLRATILRLAIQGKLVSQDPHEESAAELIRKINSQRNSLIEQEVLKKPQIFPAIQQNEIPFKVPEKWQWVRLNDVFDVRDGTHDTPKYVADGVPLVTSKNLYTGVLDLSDVKYISESDHRKISERSRVEKDEILFAMIGSIGNPVIVQTEREFSIKNVALFKYYSRELSEPMFLHLFLRTAAEQMREESAGGVQSFVSLGFLRKYLFPLPPLSEQRRIVALVNQLMSLCDELEAKLRQAETDSEKLMNAAVNHVLACVRDPSKTMEEVFA